MDTERFFSYIKTHNLYKDIAKDVETRFAASNCELNRLLSKRKCKVIGLMKSVIKRRLKFENYEEYLESIQLENKKNCLEIIKSKWILIYCFLFLNIELFITLRFKVINNST